MTDLICLNFLTCQSVDDEYISLLKKKQTESFFYTCAIRQYIDKKSVLVLTNSRIRHAPNPSFPDSVHAYLIIRILRYTMAVGHRNTYHQRPFTHFDFGISIECYTIYRCITLLYGNTKNSTAGIIYHTARSIIDTPPEEIKLCVCDSY